MWLNTAGNTAALSHQKRHLNAALGSMNASNYSWQ